MVRLKGFTIKSNQAMSVPSQRKPSAVAERSDVILARRTFSNCNSRLIQRDEGFGLEANGLEARSKAVARIYARKGKALNRLCLRLGRKLKLIFIFVRTISKQNDSTAASAKSSLMSQTSSTTRVVSSPS